MKHYATQNNLSLGSYKRLTTRPKIRRNLAKSKNKGLQHCDDATADWVMQAEPQLAFMVMARKLARERAA